MPRDLGTRLDKVAVAVSGLCAVHCLLLPLVVIAFPLLGAFAIDDTWFHRLLLFVIVPVSVVALAMGFRRHRDATVVVTGVAGILVLTVVAVAGHDLLGLTGERWATTGGGVLLAAGHLLNMARTRRLAHSTG